ncbi:MAG: fibronectin type III domain-containing protein [Patescibacteria group bacterium]|nr:fibronectin type III domain-containing protein [Patescibacteria group bacterium]
MDDTGLQSALNQLPQDLEQPVTPVPPAPQPPAPPPPPVPPEQPATQKPPGKLALNVKKNGLKIAGGALMFLLLLGGAWFGTKEVQKRQIVEKRATPGPPPAGCAITPPTNLTITNITANSAALNWTPGTGGNYVKLFVSSASGSPTTDCGRLPNKTTDSICVANENGKPIGNDPNHADIPAVPSTYQVTGMTPNTTYYWRIMMWKESGCDYAAPISSFTTTSLSPSPSPSPGTSPSPSPSPSPSISCTDLTSNKVAPAMGDTVNFTCKANFSAAAPVAIFRHNVNGGSFVESATLPLNAAGEAGLSLAIDKNGDWLVQCRVCTDSTATTCTAWGLAQ